MCGSPPTFDVTVLRRRDPGVASGMQLATGTVIDGKIVLEGATLPEGTVVTVLARDTDETFELPPELETELAASIVEADRGEIVSAAELFERLRRIA